jgi:hypothetical protein
MGKRVQLFERKTEGSWRSRSMGIRQGVTMDSLTP